MPHGSGRQTFLKVAQMYLQVIIERYSALKKNLIETKTGDKPKDFTNSTLQKLISLCQLKIFFEQLTF